MANPLSKMLGIAQHEIELLVDCAVRSTNALEKIAENLDVIKDEYVASRHRS